MAIFWNGFIVFFVIEWGLLKPNFDIFKILFLIFLIPFFLVGLLLILLFVALVVHSLVEWFVVEPPLLIVDSDSITPGSEIRVAYQQIFKRELTIKKLAVELIALEIIKQEKRMVGKKENIIDRKEDNEIYCVQSQEIIKQYTLKIPPINEMPTDLKNKEITWAVKVKVKTSISPISFTECFYITDSKLVSN